jgi:hypothetical protein
MKNGSRLSVLLSVLWVLTIAESAFGQQNPYAYFYVKQTATAKDYGYKTLGTVASKLLSEEGLLGSDVTPPEIQAPVTVQVLDGLNPANSIFVGPDGAKLDQSDLSKAVAAFVFWQPTAGGSTNSAASGEGGGQEAPTPNLIAPKEKPAAALTPAQIDSDVKAAAKTLNSAITVAKATADAARTAGIIAAAMSLLVLILFLWDRFFRKKKEVSGTDSATRQQLERIFNEMKGLSGIAALQTSVAEVLQELRGDGQIPGIGTRFANVAAALSSLERRDEENAAAVKGRLDEAIEGLAIRIEAVEKTTKFEGERVQDALTQATATISQQAAETARIMTVAEHDRAAERDQKTATRDAATLGEVRQMVEGIQQELAQRLWTPGLGDQPSLPDAMNQVKARIGEAAKRMEPGSAVGRSYLEQCSREIDTMRECLRIVSERAWGRSEAESSLLKFGDPARRYTLVDVEATALDACGEAERMTEQLRRRVMADFEGNGCSFIRPIPGITKYDPALHEDLPNLRRPTTQASQADHVFQRVSIGLAVDEGGRRRVLTKAHVGRYVYEGQYSAPPPPPQPPSESERTTLGNADTGFHSPVPPVVAAERSAQPAPTPGTETPPQEFRGPKIKIIDSPSPSTESISKMSAVQEPDRQSNQP